MAEASGRLTVPNVVTTTILTPTQPREAVGDGVEAAASGQMSRSPANIGAVHDLGEAL